MATTAPTTPREDEDTFVLAPSGRSRAGQDQQSAQLSIIAMKVRRAANALGSQARLAEWVGVSRSQATRWAGGQTLPSVETQRAVTDLEFIVTRAAMVWDSAVITDWLHGTNAFLGGATPLEMIRQGRTAEVLQAVTADDAGVYA